MFLCRRSSPTRGKSHQIRSGEAPYPKQAKGRYQMLWRNPIVPRTHPGTLFCKFLANLESEATSDG
ncbi:hypothetical protein Plhal703r1_c45g0146871 [Plasmopara halstedii]